MARRKPNKEMRNRKIAAISTPAPKGSDAKKAWRKELRAMRAGAALTGNDLQDHMNNMNQQHAFRAPSGEKQRGNRSQQKRRQIQDQL